VVKSAATRAAAAAALALLLVGCAEAPDVPNVVVWIEVDTLRADALGCYGNTARDADGDGPSPAIDALAAQSVRFERAYATAPWTVPSLVSQLTGRWPWEHGALRVVQPLDPSLDTLPARFRRAGWRTAGVTTNFITRAQYGFDRGFERWDESLATGHEGSTGAAAVARLLALADDLAREPGAGLFLFALLFEPHYRYEAHPEHRFAPQSAPRVRGDEELPALRERLDELGPDDAAFLRARYQGEVAAADAAIGALVRGLRERGLLEDAVVVFTADHGEELLERGWLGHTTTLFDELVRVPLLVRAPGLDPAVSDAPVSLVDLGATLCALAGVPHEGPTWADALRGGAAPRRYLYLHSDFEPPLPGGKAKRTLQWGVVDGATRRKWLVDHLADGGPRGALYALDDDPHERRPLDGPALRLRRGLVPEALDGADGGAAIAPEAER